MCLYAHGGHAPKHLPRLVEKAPTVSCRNSRCFLLRRLVLGDAVEIAAADGALVVIIDCSVTLERAGEVGVLTVHGRVGQASVKHHLAKLSTGHGCRRIAASGGVNAIDL